MALQDNDDNGYDFSGKEAGILGAIGFAFGLVLGPIIGYAIGLVISGFAALICMTIGLILGPMLGSWLGQAFAGPAPVRAASSPTSKASTPDKEYSSVLMSSLLGAGQSSTATNENAPVSTQESSTPLFPSVSDISTVSDETPLPSENHRPGAS